MELIHYSPNSVWLAGAGRKIKWCKICFQLFPSDQSITIRMTSIKTPGEWRHQHTSLVSSTDTCLRTSARVRDEATWLNDHTRVQTSRDQEDVRFRLKEKLKSTARWREELQEELGLNKKQTESLRRCLAKLKKALAKSDEPLKVFSWFLKEFSTLNIASPGQHRVSTLQRE